MKFITAKFHEPLGIFYHGGAFVYAVGGYVLGIYGLFALSWWVNLGATLLLGHAMTIAAYLIHECGHNTIFRSNANNARLGRILNWITGSAYGTFEDIRYKHFRHHMDNDDSVWFVYEDFFERHPLLVRVIRFFEWFYIPAHDLLMHFIMMFSAFIIPQRRKQRLRNAIVIIIRGGVFFSVLFIWPKVAIGYMAAYLIMMHILRFMDSLQHDYGSNPILFEEEHESRYGGRKTEQLHTFSNPASLSYDLPNWFTLCFGFHNAHHLRPTVPWYRLPAYYREKISNDPASVVPFKVQLKLYHKYRVNRVTHSRGDLDDLPVPMEKDYLEAVRAGKIYGGNAVSFLTSF